MAKKRRPTPAVDCVCVKCGKEAHTPPNTTHRKCSPVPENRGKWQTK